MQAEVFFGNRVTHHDVVDFTMIVCGGCGIPFMMPSKRYDNLREEHGSFHCPNGCSRRFTGKSDTQKLKDEISELKIKSENEKKVLQNRLLDEINDKRKIERKLKRAYKGVCTCCNRTFQNLANHMKTKHPDAINK